MGKLVTKFNGEKASRQDCRYMSGSFYEKNVDCFKIGIRWYRKDSGLIYYDYEHKKWCKRGSSIVVEGYVDSKGTVGKFTKSKRNVKVFDSINYRWVISKDVALSMGFYDCLSDNNFYNHKIIDDKISTGKGYPNSNYNISGTIDQARQGYDKYYNPETSFNLKKLAKLIKGYKYGLEIESSKGYIKTCDLYKHGFVPLIDGSLRNEEGRIVSYEFTSIPLEGDKGLQNIIDFCKILQQRCEFDIKCSLHIHISGYKESKNNLVVIYKLLTLLQDELLEMFPYYKTDPSGVKNKNYCRKLKELSVNINNCDKEEYKELINYQFKSIFSMLTSGHSPDSTFNNTNLIHPIGGSKWNIGSRYAIYNLNTYVFQSQRTIESRLSSPTFNKYKIIYWLLINIAILKYAETNASNILKRDKISLNEILDVYSTNMFGKDVSLVLKAYVEQRKQEFKKALSKNDKIGEEDMKNDYNYEFKSIL